MTVLANNLKLLKEKYPSIYSEIENIGINVKEYELIETKDKNKSLKITQNVNGESKSFFLHSKYNPVKEAVKFANEQYNPNCAAHVLYGFGLGYHVLEMTKQMRSCSRLYVIENNIEVFRVALENINLEQIILHPSVELLISKDASYLAQKMKEIIKQNVNLICHPASLKAIPDENEYFKFVMENWNLKKSITDDYNNIIQKNLNHNLKLDSLNVGIFFNQFKGIPIVIVSTGPSLDKNIDLLREVKNKALIISVGSALKPLLMRNIIPDFFIIIDPQIETYYQIQGFENLNIPFIYLATAASYTVSEYKGIKLIACQEKEYLRQQDKPEYVVDSGGSVATTALDIAIKMGGSPVILVGQDLAYTGGKNHAEYGTHMDINSPQLKNMRRVKGQDGKILYTSLGLLSYKYWIENRIEKENITFINATEGGAYINGMTHMSLKNVIESYLHNNFDFDNMINTILNSFSL
jgi:hypothetical protein